MSIIQSIILGIIQGLTEFLPISSSGHLVLAQNLFGFKEAGLSFDVALHLGTFLALVLFFWRDWWKLFKAFGRSLKQWNFKNDSQQRLFYFLIIASIPGALFGALLEKQAETIFRSTYLVLINLTIIAILFLIVEKVAKKARNLKQATLKDSLIIGFSQALAIIPGVSRSGITISAGLFSGLKREAAARFSFLLATPIIFGAGLMHISKIYEQGNNSTGWLNIVTGALTSFFVSYLCIKYLLRYLRNHTLNVFAYYRFLLVLMIIMYLIIKGI